MKTQVIWKPVAGSAALVLALAAWAPGQEPEANLGTMPYIERHSVFKPALNIPTRRPLQETGYEFPTKPLFLKGYSGYLYGRAAREAFVPTGYGVGNIQPVGVGEPRRCGPRLFGLWRRY